MLTLVATPIGNLQDITLRALETLRQADFVASEDTRKTGLLLKYFEINKPQIAYHEYNEQQAGRRILALLEEGKSVAVVTNAGTPGISDPGYTLVRKAIEADIEVTMAPGPTGLIMALVLSGLPVHSFTFRGFPPRKSGPRRRFMEVDKHAPHTLLFYESPYRLESFFTDALAVYGDREAALANDLTKKFEKVERGTISHLLQSVTGDKAKGEYIIAIAGSDRAFVPEEEDTASESDVVIVKRKKPKFAHLASETNEDEDTEGDASSDSPLLELGEGLGVRATPLPELGEGAENEDRHAG